MTFAEQFIQSRGRPIKIDDGRVAHMLYRRDVSAGQRLRLHWITKTKSPVQGVSMSVEGGALRVAELEAKDVVLWSDSAPAEITVYCVGKAVRELTLWNCWRDDRGTTQAWVGNSGMIIEECDSDTLRFSCNSGPEVTFSDLVFDLRG